MCLDSRHVYIYIKKLYSFDTCTCTVCMWLTIVQKWILMCLGTYMYATRFHITNIIISIINDNQNNDILTSCYNNVYYTCHQRDFVQQYCFD